MFADSLIDEAHSALKSCIDRPMIREAKWSCVVTDLTKVGAFAEDAISPSRNSSFLAEVGISKARAIPA
jgi:hypothetical protein